MANQIDNSPERAGIFSLQSFVEKMFARPTVSEDLWTIVYTLIGGGAIIALLSLWGVYESYGITSYLCMAGVVLGAILAMGGAAIATSGEKNIPTKSVGVLTIWGAREPVVLPEGDKLVANWWPLRIDIQTVNVEAKPFKFTYMEVRCRAPIDDLSTTTKKSSSPKTGGAVTVTLELTVVPDSSDENADRIIRFQNSGGMEGVSSILSGMFAQACRHQASYYDWEQFSSLKNELSAALLAEVTEINFRKLPREADGTVSAETLKVDAETYTTFDEVDPYDYLFPVTQEERRVDDITLEPEQLRLKESEEAKARKCRDQDIAVFLRIASENGVSDIKNLGIKIKRLNVTAIEPEGKLEDEADGAAIEKQQRLKETWDFETELSLATLYIDAAKSREETMTLDAALERVRINRGRATETVVRSSGNPLMDAAALVGQKGK